MPGQTSSPIRALGVLTGGGDVPGLNDAIKALVYRAEHMGYAYLKRKTSKQPRSISLLCILEKGILTPSPSSSFLKEQR